MRLFSLVIFLLFIVQSTFASVTPGSNRVDGIKGEKNSFTRNAPLPKWAQALAEIPVTQRKDPVVIRLNETQAIVETEPAVLVNRVIQVNEQAALGGIGQFGIPYYPAYQKLNLHRVAILRGSQILDRTSTVNTRLLQREVGVESSMYGGATTVQLLLEDVRVGDALWITYTTVGENPVFGKRWASDFSWDGAAPIELRRLTIMHPKQRPILWKQLGDFRKNIISPQIDEVGNLRRLLFEGKNIDAIEQEPSIPNDYLPVRMLQFSEYNNWSEVEAWANKLFPKVSSRVELKKLAQTFSNKPTPMEKASAALHWVQNEVRYFSVSIGENSHRPQSPETVLKRRYGDCKDKSYLLISLLEELGIEAYPVLLSAQSPKLPLKLIASPSWFDHVIVQIKLDGQFFYVDPTRTGQASPIGKIEPAFPSATVLVVGASPTTELTTLPERVLTEPKFEHVENMVIPNFDGSATLETRQIFRGDYADWARVRYPMMQPAEIKKEMLSLYEKMYSGVTLIGLPTFKDVPEQNRFEVIASYNLPKALTQKEGRHWIEYDSQVLESTIGIPDKVVREYPFALLRDKYRGRYRLNITWPTHMRLNDTPSAKLIDNPFFKLSEEYSYRGNYLSYLMDFQLKVGTVSAKDLPELQTNAKRLVEFVSGKFHIDDGLKVSDDALNFSFRDLDTLRGAKDIVAIANRFKGTKDDDLDPNQICDWLLLSSKLAEATGRSAKQLGFDFESFPASTYAKPGGKLCLARNLFAHGSFAKSVALFQGEPSLKDDDSLVRELAWARFYSGDSEGALKEMTRYRNARDKLEQGTTGFDIANQIALYQRTGKSIPVELINIASEIPDGPWPRPLIAMQVGLLSEEALLKIAEDLPADARELALNDAWFYIAQMRLAKKDIRGAKVALRWFKVNGIRSSDLTLLAGLELQRLEVSDANYDAAETAFEKNNNVLGLEKLRLSANAGVAKAQYRLALAYYDGEIIKQDYAQAIFWFEKAAAQEVPGAVNMLGVVYAKGKGVPKDDGIATSWFKKGAQLGDVHSLYNLGSRYLEGKTVEQDDKQGFFYIRQSAELEHSDAQADLARLYMDGKRVKKNYFLATLWSSRASAKGDADGQLLLGYLYEKGYGIPKNLEIANKYYRLAAEQGHSQAQYNLAYNTANGIGVAKDQKAAAEWYEKAAKQGFAKAQSAIGLSYLFGYGVRRDSQIARTWLEAAAGSGDAEAQSELGDIYDSGDGVPLDWVKAAMYYRKAAEQGNVFAQSSLAVKLRHGRGVEKNLVEASMWYQKAVDQNSAYAKNELGDMYENGHGVKQDFGRAIELYKQAALEGNGMGFISLASMHDKGIGVPKNLILAYVYTQLALKLDNRFTARRDEAAKKLTKDEISLGDSIIENWKPSMDFPMEVNFKRDK
jgi:TPR repeat protein/transglutaminase-like putative cysteine protease